MRVAIISDVHNNTTNLQKVLDYCGKNKIEKLICCGDLASMETLDFLNDNFSGEIFYCFGNMDDGHLQSYNFEAKYKNTWIFKNHGEASLGGFASESRAVAFVHYPDKAKELGKTGKYTHVFYGHTHKPWIEKIGGCAMLNPGNVAGELFPPTFAVWETESDKFKLIRINEIRNVIPSEVEESN